MTQRTGTADLDPTRHYIIAIGLSDGDHYLDIRDTDTDANDQAHTVGLTATDYARLLDGPDTAGHRADVANAAGLPDGAWLTLSEMQPGAGEYDARYYDVDLPDEAR